MATIVHFSDGVIVNSQKKNKNKKEADNEDHHVNVEPVRGACVVACIVERKKAHAHSCVLVEGVVVLCLCCFLVSFVF